MTSGSQNPPARVISLAARRAATMSGYSAKAVWGGGPVPVRPRQAEGTLIAFPVRAGEPTIASTGEWGPSAA